MMILSIEELRRDEFYRLPPEAFVDRDTVAAVRYLGRGSLDQVAIAGGGPRYMRIGQRALYRKSDVLAWMESNGRVVEAVAQPAPEPTPSRQKRARVVGWAATTRVQALRDAADICDRIANDPLTEDTVGVSTACQCADAIREVAQRVETAIG